MRPGASSFEPTLYQTSTARPRASGGPRAGSPRARSAACTSRRAAPAGLPTGGSAAPRAGASCAGAAAISGSGGGATGHRDDGHEHGHRTQHAGCLARDERRARHSVAIGGGDYLGESSSTVMASPSQPPAAAPPAESDEELVARARAKDFVAFEKLLDRYEDQIFRLAYRFVRNETEAKEILQDTFLTIWRKLDTFKGDSQFRAGSTGWRPMRLSCACGRSAGIRRCRRKTCPSATSTTTGRCRRRRELGEAAG